MYLILCIYSFIKWASQVVLTVKNLPANAGNKRDAGLIPGWERPPGGGNGKPLQYSWRIPWTEEPTVHRVAKS